MNEFMHVAEIALPLLLQGLGTTAAISVFNTKRNKMKKNLIILTINTYIIYK